MARLYDEDLGVFLGVDPLEGQRSWVSPYNYVQNNPIMRLDPDGMLDGKYIDSEGNEIGEDGSEDDNYYLVSDEDAVTIKGNTENGKTTPLEQVGFYTDLPHPSMRPYVKELISLSDEDKSAEYGMLLDNGTYRIVKSNTETKYIDGGHEGCITSSGNQWNKHGVSEVQDDFFVLNLKLGSNWGIQFHTHNYDQSRSQVYGVSLPSNPEDFVNIWFRTGAVIDNNNRQIHFHNKLESKPQFARKATLSMSYEAFFNY